MRNERDANEALQNFAASRPLPRASAPIRRRERRTMSLAALTWISAILCTILGILWFPVP